MAFPNGKKSYAGLTDAERWRWHSEIYAFRHVVLDAPLQPKCPTDEEGKWFDRYMIDPLVVILRDKRERSKQARKDTRDAKFQREGRDIVNKWAQERGFLDLDDYCERNNIPWVDAYTEIVQEICATTAHESGIVFPARIGNFRSLADAIGGVRSTHRQGPGIPEESAA